MRAFLVIAACVLLTSPGVAAQDLRPFFFDVKAEGAGFVEARTGRRVVLVQGRVEETEEERVLSLEGWSLDARIDKARMEVFGRPATVFTTSESRFRATFRTLPGGRLKHVQARVVALRKQWSKEPLLEPFVRAVEGVKQAIEEEDGYRADKRLHDMRDLRLGVGAQQVALVLEVERDGLAGRWRERWAVENAVGFGGEEKARESRSVEVLLEPGRGGEPGWLEVRRDESQRVRPFPSRAMAWGGELLRRFPDLERSFPTGFRIEPGREGPLVSLEGSFQLGSFVSVRGRRLVCRRPPEQAGEPGPVEVEPATAAFLQALHRGRLPDELTP